MKPKHVSGCVAGALAFALAGPAFAQHEGMGGSTGEEYEDEAAEEERAEEEAYEEEALQEEEAMQQEPREPEPMAREPEFQEPQRRERGPAALARDIGVGFSVGGGVTQFTDDDARDFTDVGGAWEARAAFGTKSPVGIEAAYVGQAQDISALGLDEDAVLLGNGAEAAARINVPVVEFVTPYALGGVGWTHYNLANEDFNTSAVQDDDNVGYIPLGAGVTWRAGAAALDLRGVYRQAFNEDILATADGNEASLSSWAAIARLGFEF